MAIYVYNGPVVLPQRGGSKAFSISIDGNAHKDGKRVTNWSNVRCSASWVTNVSYEDSNSDDGKTYSYNFYITATASNNTSQRYTIVYADYTLEDGTTGTASVYIYQEPNNNISKDCSNPLLFNWDNSKETISPRFSYRGAAKETDILTPTVSNDYFTVYATAGGAEQEGFAEEYDIDARYCNALAEDRKATATFKYINPSTSVEQSYVIHLTQKGHPYPFGFTKQGGAEIGIVSNINPLKIIRNIPFNSNTLTLECNYPFLTGNYDIHFDSYNSDIATFTTSTNGRADGTLYNTIKVTFKENTSVYSRFVDLITSYTTKDGLSYTDTVRLMQDESDGTNIESQVTANINQLKFKWDGTKELYDNITINYLGNINGYTNSVSADWITVGSGTIVENTNGTNIKVNYPISVSKNETGVARTGTVTFSGDFNNGSKSFTLTVSQAKKTELDVYEPEDVPVESGEYCGPIWKDVEYNFGGTSQVDYSIYVVGRQRVGNTFVDIDTLIFTGRSCKRPNTNSNTILVNKICQSYMDTPTLDKDAVGVGGGYGVFKLKSADGSVEYKTYRFVNDWSYSKDFKVGALNHPILNSNEVIKGQYLPFTVFAAAESVAVMYGIVYDKDATDEYGQPLSNWTNVVYMKNGVETEMFPYKDRRWGAASYYIADLTFNVVADCNVKYVLYYVNPWGGYDWFPIKGKVTETDNITQYSYTQNYNNTTWEFGKKRYLSEIKKKYTLNTHWLTEDESSRMWYLMQSNTVYLHNLEEDTIEPVVITATSQEHKKYGMKSSRISYQIEVETSQTRERI